MLFSRFATAVVGNHCLNLMSKGKIYGYNTHSHTVVDCGPLSDPDSDQVTLTNTTFGSTASYTCYSNPAWVVGTDMRTYMVNGEWSGEALARHHK